MDCSVTAAQETAYRPHTCGGILQYTARALVGGTRCRPQTGRARVLGAALQQWLTAVQAAPGPPPPKKRCR